MTEKPKPPPAPIREGLKVEQRPGRRPCLLAAAGRATGTALCPVFGAPCVGKNSAASSPGDHSDIRGRLIRYLSRPASCRLPGAGVRGGLLAAVDAGGSRGLASN
jgi:hypothetical protein